MNYFSLILFVFICSLSFSQSKKQLKKNNIQQLESFLAFPEGKLIQSVKKFDSNGNEVFFEEYDEKGRLEKKRERIYDKNNLLLEERDYNVRGELKKTEKYEYDLGLLIKLSIFNDKNELIKLHETSYNGFEEKIKEVTKDGKGSVLESIEYMYDKNGLKTDKKTFDKEGKLIEHKIYEYKEF